MSIQNINQIYLNECLKMGYDVGWFNMTMNDWVVPQKIDRNCVFDVNDRQGVYTAYHYRNSAWISAVIVNKSFRNCGTATLMDSHVVKYLHNVCGIKAIGVYCPESEIARRQKFGSVLDPIPHIATCYTCNNLDLIDKQYINSGQNFITHPNSDDISDFIEMDQQIFGYDRRVLFENYPNNIMITRDKQSGRISGSIIIRSGGTGSRFGPLYADSSIIATDLMIHAMDTVPNNQRKMCEIWINDSNDNANKFIMKLGWEKQFQCYRMWHLSDKNVMLPKNNNTQEFAIAGPDIG